MPPRAARPGRLPAVPRYEFGAPLGSGGLGTVYRALDLYTGRAVATFAYGQRHPVVDTNVRRVVSRAVEGKPDAGPATTAADLAAMADLLPLDAARAARASIAFMELGAVVCVARSPRCGVCPVFASCAWRQAGCQRDSSADPASPHAGCFPFGHAFLESGHGLRIYFASQHGRHAQLLFKFTKGLVSVPPPPCQTFVALQH